MSMVINGKLINRGLNGFFRVFRGLSADYPKFIRSIRSYYKVTINRGYLGYFRVFEGVFICQSNSKETPKFQSNSKLYKLKSKVFRGFPRFLWP